jgi:acyl-coenzyme A synthetase/AMP-(fatty) acid ligase
MQNKYIGLQADDSRRLSIGVLTKLKTGYCFVPINPTFANDRIRFIIDDCNINILLTDKTNYEIARQLKGETSSVAHLVCIDAILIRDGKDAEVKEQIEMAWGRIFRTAYVIYTSGSTGKPRRQKMTFIKLLHLGGERLSGKIKRNALNVSSPGCFIYNGYGQTDKPVQRVRKISLFCPGAVMVFVGVGFGK